MRFFFIFLLLSGISRSRSIKIERSMKKYPWGRILRFFGQTRQRHPLAYSAQAGRSFHFFAQVPTFEVGAGDKGVRFREFIWDLSGINMG